MTDFLIKLINSILTVFPHDPFQPFIAEISENISPFLGYVNYYIPFGRLVIILHAWIACIAAFFAWQALARYLHLIK